MKLTGSLPFDQMVNAPRAGDVLRIVRRVVYEPPKYDDPVYEYEIEYEVEVEPVREEVTVGSC